MAANTVLLDFSIEPTRIGDELSRKDMVKVIKENLEKYFGNLKMIYDMLVDDGYMCILNDAVSTIFTVRFFNEGLITVNIEYWKKEGDTQRISFEVCKNFLLPFSIVSHFTWSNWFKISLSLNWKILRTHIVSRLLILYIATCDE